MDSRDFKRWTENIAEFLINYKKDIENKDVSPNFKVGRSTTGLSDVVPDYSEEFGTIFEDFQNKILPSIVNWNHPQFFSYYPSPNSYPSVLGDMLSIAIGGVGFTWSANPALSELENLMADWYAKLLNLPPDFIYEKSNQVGGGCIQSDATNALYNCILAARHRAMGKLCSGNDRDCFYENMEKLVVYSSADAQDYVGKVCKAEKLILRVIPTAESGVLLAKAIRQSLLEDEDLIPMMVVATLGTFSKFAVDEILEIGKICHEYNCQWLHVDGSYGGNALLLKRYQNMLDGLAYADSICIDPGNWLQVGLDCTVLWLRNVEQYKRCFVINPTYLKHNIPGAIDYRHYGIALSRRFRALKLWLTFRTYGKNGLNRRLRKYIMYAKMFGDLLNEHPETFVVVQQKYTFTNFFLKDKDEKTNKAFLKYVNASGKILLFPVTYDGRFTLRFTVSYEHETTAHIKQAVVFIQECVNKFSEKHIDTEDSDITIDENSDEDY